MHFLALLGAFALLVVSAIADVSTDVFYWPVGAAQPSVLARIAYDRASWKSELLSYHPPTDARDGLVRVGLYTSTPTNSRQWIGSLVSVASLIGEDRPTLRLHLGPAGDVYHVSVASSTGAKATGAQVEIVSSQPGVQPHLNRPVVVSPDGGNTEEVVEKSFLQKYWWVFLIIAFLSMSGSAGGQS
ncbi:uncharacterized protein N7498_006269 [Penicillium cinerascens]|uniref:Uncharacterized protein n=1 Tax=Penicillium cinerascens TaxID=70096 RepID=A0A9W9SXC7_9EURO|nr:uncharacterized protein N7498_006269 [Penicillium cinerascens]KAJ5201606.1 hypothetical protein N7498_006269 [Penicillium cinerascens]